MTFKRISILFSFFSFLLAFITLLLYSSSEIISKFSKWPFLLLFLYLLNFATLYLLYKYSKKRSVKFINIYMLTSFGKMILYVVIMMLYVYLIPSEAIPFVIIFLFYFMAYLIFEVVVLIKLNKNISF